MLDAQLRIGIPARIEQHKDRFDVVLGGDIEEDVDALFKAVWILRIKLVVKEDAHGVHANAFGEAQFLVDLSRIEAVLFPHLKLIDGVGGNIVAADKPALLAVPRLGFFRRPALGRCIGRLRLGGKG